MASADVDKVLEKLAKDVEAAVHAMYRGEVRQMTLRSKSGTMVRDAQAAIKEALAKAGGSAGGSAVGVATPASSRPSAAAPVMAGAAVGWSKEEGEAVLKCITAWLPMGPPNSADPASRCVAAARELTPTWDQRQKALAAVKRI